MTSGGPGGHLMSRVTRRGLRNSGSTSAREHGPNSAVLRAHSRNTTGVIPCGHHGHNFVPHRSRDHCGRTALSPSHCSAVSCNPLGPLLEKGDNSPRVCDS